MRLLWYQTGDNEIVFLKCVRPWVDFGLKTKEENGAENEKSDVLRSGKWMNMETDDQMTRKINWEIELSIQKKKSRIERVSIHKLCRISNLVVSVQNNQT